jgi:hypothetical protein
MKPIAAHLASRWPFIVLALALLGGAVFFQNCAGYGSATVSSSSVTAAATPTNCDPTISNCSLATALSMRINLASPLIVYSTQTSFDIGGDCDAGGAPSSLQWNLGLTSNSSSSYSSGSVPLGSACNSVDRWQALVTFPTNAVATAAGTPYTLNVTMTAAGTLGTASTTQSMQITYSSAAP